MSLLKSHLLVTLGYYASFTALGLCLAVIGPTIPALAEQTHSPFSALGIIFTVREFGFILTALQGAKLFDRFRGNLLMGVALCVAGILFLLIPMLPWLWALLICFFMLGTMAGFVDIGGNTLLVSIYHKRVAPYMNGLHFFFGIGAFISPLIVAQVLQKSNSIQWAYWSIAFLILPIGVLMTRLPTPQHQAHTNIVVQAQSEKGMIILLAVLLGLYVGAEVGYGGWISTYAVMQKLSTTTAEAAVFASGYWGSFTVGRLMAIIAAVRIPSLYVIVGSFTGAFLCALIWLLFPSSLVVLWGVTLGFGFFTGPIFATIVSYTGELMRLSARIAGLIFLGASFGAMCLPWLIGYLFPSLGAISLIVVIVIAMGLCLGVMGIIVNIHRRGIRLVENEVTL